jgi:hypothetical protein
VHVLIHSKRLGKSSPMRLSLIGDSQSTTLGVSQISLSDRMVAWFICKYSVGPETPSVSCHLGRRRVVTLR